MKSKIWREKKLNVIVVENLVNRRDTGWKMRNCIFSHSWVCNGRSGQWNAERKMIETQRDSASLTLIHMTEAITQKPVFPGHWLHKRASMSPVGSSGRIFQLPDTLFVRSSPAYEILLMPTLPASPEGSLISSRNIWCSRTLIHSHHFSPQYYFLKNHRWLATPLQSHQAERWESKVKVKAAQSCLTLCDPMDNTVHGILQARIPEWVAILFSRRSSQPGDWTQVSRIKGGFFTSWATRETQEYWSG